MKFKGWKFFDRFYVGQWETQEKFVWFELINGACGCKFFTFCNILFMYRHKECVW